MAIIGALLPKRHVASRTAKFNTDADTIWKTMTDFASAPSWWPEVKEMNRLPDRNGHAVWVQVTKQGNMPMEVIELDPPRRMVTKVADENLPFGGSWTYEIAPVAGGCTLTITEDGEIYNPIFRFMARFFFGYHATMESYLKNLGRKFGEQIAFTES
jgi:hypothetical protein